MNAPPDFSASRPAEELFKARVAVSIAFLLLGVGVGLWAVHIPIVQALLGLLVEAVSGESLDSFCRKQFFEPLGMVDTAREAQERAMLALGRRMSVIVGQMDEQCGKQLLSMTVEQVSRMTTERAMDALRRKA